MEKILIVDDNEYLRYTLTEVLQDAGYSSFAVENGDKAIEEIKSKVYDLVILVIMLTAFGDIRSAVQAMKQGAKDYITKPFENDAMILTIKKTLEMKYLNEEVNLLRRKIVETTKSGQVIGQSPAMQAVFEQVNIVAPSTLTVLLQGESGTGKEIIANMIHAKSDRKDKPMIAVDCGAIPDTLMESELFGH